MKELRFPAIVTLALVFAFGCHHPDGGGDNGGGPPDPVDTVMWINHLDMLAGDPSVQVSFNAVSSGVGGGLSGLIIESNAVGDTAPTGGNKVVQKGTLVPPGWLVTGVRTCYELSDARSFITQVRLAQVQDPPATAVVRLDDGADLVDPGPICVDSTSTTVDPAEGELLLSLRLDFGDTSDRIVVRALGLNLRSRP
jgi:hypothetical protein